MTPEQMHHFSDQVKKSHQIDPASAKTHPGQETAAWNTKKFIQ
jgi:hypothetical protein